MLKRVMTKPWENLLTAHENTPCLQRRGFLKVAALAAVSGLATTPALARVSARKERRLHFYVPRSGETLSVVYWTPRDGYINSSLREISWALRDCRTDQMMIYDPKVLDQLYVLQLQMDYRKPVHVISGYRSPATNAMLRRTNKRVARRSYHMQGRALDLRMPGRSVAELRRAAVTLKAGGVGYYPRSNFIHIDTGPIRYWS